MFLIFQSDYGEESVVADVNPAREFSASWMRGVPFAEQPPEPLVLEWDPDHEQGLRLPYYSAGTVLLTKNLVAALEKAGVDNLQCYPALIRSSAGEDCLEYFAVNILGIVDAIDFENSEILGSGPDDMLVESLAIDKNKAGDVKMFRLKGAENVVVIAQEVYDALGDAQQGLDCIDPAEYFG